MTFIYMYLWQAIGGMLKCYFLIHTQTLLTYCFVEIYYEDNMNVENHVPCFVIGYILFTWVSQNNFRLFHGHLIARFQRIEMVKYSNEFMSLVRF